MLKDIQSEYSGIASYVLLDWYVKNYYIAKKQCIISGDIMEIASADLAAIEGYAFVSISELD